MTGGRLILRGRGLEASWRCPWRQASICCARGRAAPVGSGAGGGRMGAPGSSRGLDALAGLGLRRVRDRGRCWLGDLGAAGISAANAVLELQDAAPEGAAGGGQPLGSE